MMGILAWILGSLGGACAIVSILTAVAVIPEVLMLTWIFWMMLGAILLLGSIASALGRGGYE